MVLARRRRNARTVQNFGLMMMQTVPEPGQVVVVRQRPFVVADVKASALPAEATLGGTVKEHLVTLSSVEDEGLGEELQVVWELEAGTTCQEKAGLPELREVDDPRAFDAFLDAVTWGSVSQADDKALQAPFRSGVEVDEYQLDPVVRALQMPRVNLLIAADVGLGKTIESGLVAQELILRHRVRTILIVRPQLEGVVESVMPRMPALHTRPAGSSPGPSSPPMSRRKVSSAVLPTCLVSKRA